MSEARTTEILEKVKNQNLSEQDFFVVDANGANTSVPFEVTGNVADQLAITAAADEKIIIKAFVICGDGSQGRADIKRGSELNATLLPVYFSTFNRASSSGNLNLELNAGEDLYIHTEGRLAESNTFFGITYYKVGV